MNILTKQAYLPFNLRRIPYKPLCPVFSYRSRLCSGFLESGIWIFDFMSFIKSKEAGVCFFLKPLYSVAVFKHNLLFQRKTLIFYIHESCLPLVFSSIIDRYVINYKGKEFSYVFKKTENRRLMRYYFTGGGYCEAARKLGMEAVCFTTKENAVMELKKLGVY